MRETETVLSIIGTLPPESDHWRARYGETRAAGSGRGRRKRTRIAGTSPAAYFMLRGRAPNEGRHSAFQGALRGPWTGIRRAGQQGVYPRYRAGQGPLPGGLPG
jgi:hypothetical protein